MRNLQRIGLITAVCLVCCVFMLAQNPDSATQLSTGQLIDCLSTDSLFSNCCCPDQFVIYDELIRRTPIDQLIAAYQQSQDVIQREHILESVLYGIQASKITDFMRSELDTSHNKNNYYVAMYLAKQGDTIAMSILNRHYRQWQVSSWQLSYTAQLFSKFKYRPAIGNLVESLDAASLNLSGEAYEALKKFYPDSPEFRSPTEAKRYYLKRIQRQRAR